MFWKWTKRIGLGLIGTLALAAVCGTLYQTISTKIDEKRYPPTGKMVDIGGYSLHIDCRGDGGPAVVIDSGLGSYSLDWALVQSNIAKFTTVCSYDRAGYGWSDESPKERTSNNIVEELHTLLQNAGIPAPYILVGHSLGGLNARLYASRYPNEVAGIVLVDASHEDYFDKIPKFAIPNEQMTLLMSRIGLLRLFSHIYPSPLENLLKQFPPNIKQIRMAQIQTTKVAMASLKELSALEKSLSQAKNDGGHLNDIPLIIITAGQNMPSEGMGISQEELDGYYQVHLEHQKKLLSKSTQSRQIFAEKSDHNIPLRQPEIIVEAIHDLIIEQCHSQESGRGGVDKKISA